jgi:redox-sensitive bicupin YhaK (pirin superfamily)
MTAGAGVVHSEMPSPSLLEQGGRIHGFQIWINLPASEKMIAPRYQDLPAGQMPSATSEDGLTHVRVIAGEAMGVSAALETLTPIVYHHWTLAPGGSAEIPLCADHNVLIYVFGGSLVLQPGGEEVRDGQVVIYDEGESVGVACPDSHMESAHFLLLAGRPIGEPISRYGPFVMNTFAEIRQAFLDYQLGRMGRIDRDEPA